MKQQFNLIHSNKISITGIIALISLVCLHGTSWGKSGDVSIISPANNGVYTSDFTASIGYNVTPITGIQKTTTPCEPYTHNKLQGLQYGVLEILDYYYEPSINKYILSTLQYSIDNNSTMTKVADVYSGNSQAIPVTINALNMNSGAHTATFKMTNVSSQRCDYNCTKCHSGDTSYSAWTRIDGGVFAQSSPLSFTVVHPIVAAPSLISPANRFFTGSTSTTSVGFSWGSVPNATSYKLDIRDASTGSLVQEGTPATTSFNSMSLQPMKKYSWQVAGSNSITPTGPFSETRQFIVAECWPEVGTGNGYSIDTCYDGSNYLLRDISRRANLNVGGHNGHMPDSASITTQLYGASGPVVDSDNNWADAGQIAGVNAHVNAGLVYDFMLSTLKFELTDGTGINSYDKLGSTMKSVVDVMLFPSDLTQCLNNAFWYQLGGYLGYCATSPGRASDSSTIDVVAHEWGHAVTNNASLRGPGVGFNRTIAESGALDEAFSDWLGVAVQKYAGSYNWTIGEPVEIVRNLEDPTKTGQPDTYGSAKWNFYNGWPINTRIYYYSGVPNKMFWLLSEPGIHYHNGVTVSGIGIDKAIQIAFRSNMKKWPTNATFEGTRQGMISAAEELYGAGSLEVGQVINAWKAVGYSKASSPTTKGLIPLLLNILF